MKIPGVLVDCVVVARPENHWQTYGTPYNPAFSCEFKVPTASVEPLAMDDRKIIARRAAFELRPNMVVNLGIGMPEGVASVANEEGIFDFLTLTAEAGSIGGIPRAARISVRRRTWTACWTCTSSSISTTAGGSTWPVSGLRRWTATET